jgi:ADP-heptose:LPS heptosyltransferase
MLRNILIFHSGALGDFIQTWPLGLALGRLFPQSRVVYITQKQKGILAEKLLRLESMDVETGWHHLFGDGSRLPEVCRQKLESAHSVFTFVAKSGDEWTKTVLSINPSAQVICVEPGPPKRMLESLAAFPAVASGISQMLLSIADKGIRPVRRNETGPVAVHPGSGSPGKCWPIDSYLQLIEQLHHAGHRCRIILGEVELERWPADHLSRLHAADETVHPATYFDLLNELSQCSAFVGNDSGPGHLAGIIAIPSVVLFGPTDPADWKPIGPRVTAIRKQPLDSLPVDDVLQAVLSVLPQTLVQAKAD